jgi:hypothetical protein
MVDSTWIAHTDNKRRGRLSIISHLLSEIPYKSLSPNNVTLPKRQRPDGYKEPKLSVRHIPTPVLIRVSTALVVPDATRKAGMTTARPPRRRALAAGGVADHPHRMIAPRTSGRIVAGSR